MKGGGDGEGGGGGETVPVWTTQDGGPPVGYKAGAEFPFPIPPGPQSLCIDILPVS